MESYCLNDFPTFKKIYSHQFLVSLSVHFISHIFVNHRYCDVIILQRTISRILKEEFFGKTICKGNGRIGFEQRSEEIIREVAANPR